MDHLVPATGHQLVQPESVLYYFLTCAHKCLKTRPRPPGECGLLSLNTDFLSKPTLQPCTGTGKGGFATGY